MATPKKKSSKKKKVKRASKVAKGNKLDNVTAQHVDMYWLYTPHVMSAVVIIVVGLLYFSTIAQPAGNTYFDNNVRAAAAIAAFIVAGGLVVFPNGPFVRPHPLFWRFAFGMGFIYQLGLIYLLFQTKDDARQSLTIFNPTLGVKLEDVSYAEDCTLTLSNLKEKVFDVFFVSHFMGWLLKTLMIRDPVVCWVTSIQWELVEVMFKHMLPNFAECWWDQWILDVLLTNGLGIVAGTFLNRYLCMREYDWGGSNSVAEAKGVYGKVSRGLLQFTPSSWVSMNWEYTRSIKKFLAVQVMLLALHAEELSHFFLKDVLWIPPPDNLNGARLLIWWLLGCALFRQVYEYQEDPECKSVGKFTFLGLVILSTEFLVSYKFSDGEFSGTMSPTVKTGTIIGFSLYTLACLLYCIRIHRNQNKDKAE